MTSATRAVHGVLLPGFSGTSAPGWLLDAARDGLAGVVLFAGNTPDTPTTAELTSALHVTSPGLLVAVDEEGGDVSRLQAVGGSFLPGAAALGAVDDVVLTQRCGRALGDVLRASGVDLDLAPVLDVASRPDNPVIGVRSFGAAPDLVARHGVAFLAGLRAAGVAACGKHFPGHGDTAVDSHVSLPSLDVGLEQLSTRDLPPFRAAIDAGCDALMTGHLHVPCLGHAPASLEPAATRLVRDLGFTGPIVTDALDMGALAEDPGFGEACVRALAAGADLLCLGTTAGRDDEALFRTARDALLAAVGAGRISVARLAQAAARTAMLHRNLVARRDRTDPMPLSQVMRVLEEVGAEAAARAVRTVGDVHLGPGDVVVDLRRRTDHAAASRSTAVTAVLAADLGMDVVPVDSRAVWASARRVAVVTRDHDALLDDVLATRPDAVVLHTGVPEAAPRAANLALTYGVSLAGAREVARRCAA
ncbi:MAG: glycoside hydrolase family 3 protein [Actinomycetales bacterium]|nr:glycoside hydrolase family 3 protein [Actinomycetales bacterium]